MPPVSVCVSWGLTSLPQAQSEHSSTQPVSPKLPHLEAGSGTGPSVQYACLQLQTYVVPFAQWLLQHHSQSTAEQITFVPCLYLLAR